MTLNFRHTGILLALLLLSIEWRADNREGISHPVALHLRDSSAIPLSRPGAEAEASVFNDTRLNYKQQENIKAPDSGNFLEWLANRLFRNTDDAHVDRARKLLIWVVVIVSLLIMIWLLFKSDLTRLTRQSPSSAGFSFSDISEDLHSIDYGKRIAEALAEHNYRLAIRWHYLELLYTLDEKQLIAFVPYKTGMDYHNELAGKKLQGGFAALSRVYDYIWYGEFVINSDAYLNNAREFSNFKEQLNVQGK